MKKILSILMLATVMVACSHEEQPQLPEEPSAPKTYTMTIEATKGSDTRALGLENNTLYAAWKKGEKVAVVTPDLSSAAYHRMQIGELTAQGNGVSTILSGQLYGEPALDDLMFVYPRFPLDYTGQKGTLEDLALRYDYSYQDAYPYYNFLTVNGEEITGSISSPFYNYQAVIRFNLVKDNGDLMAKELKIHDSSEQLLLVTYFGSDDVFGDIIITPDDPSSEIWAAIYKASGLSSITLTATDVDNNIYTFTQDGVTWSPGNYYTVNVKMKPCHRVIIDPNMEHGTVQVSPSETLQNGEMFTLTIVPESANYVLEYLSYSFNNQEIPLTEYVENNTIQISMPDADVLIKATFKYVELYSIIDDGTTNGSISISPSSVVEAGTWVTLTITPSNNYVFESLTVDNVDRTSEVVLNKYSFEMPDHDVNVTATFVETPGVGAGRGGYGTVNQGTWNNN